MSSLKLPEIFAVVNYGLSQLLQVNMWTWSSGAVLMLVSWGPDVIRYVKYTSGENSQVSRCKWNAIS